ncbi:MAG TPA: hypothetical protein VEF07_08635 [Candidatus Binataceae bacterium]|nr:hypothetical protein [Candidatus Binataceae bacterium]
MSFLLIACALELRDTRRRLGELHSAPLISLTEAIPLAKPADSNSSLIDNIKRFKRQFFAPFANAFLYSTKESLQPKLHYYYGRAKIMSDFVGMIVRLGVCGFIIVYIFHKYDLTTSRYEGVMLYLGSGEVILFTIMFAWNVQQVIFEYLLSELAVHRNMTIRVIVLIYNLVLLIAIYTVIQSVVAQMATATLPR